MKNALSIRGTIARHLRWSIAVAALMVGMVAGGAAYAASGTVPSTAKDAFLKTKASVALPRTGGTPVMLNTVTLPAGAWVLSDAVTAVNYGPSDYVRCSYFRNGVNLGGSTTMVGDNSQPGSMGPGVIVANLASGLAIKSSTTFTISLGCFHDTDTPAANDPGYIDPGAILTAHKSGGLSIF